MRVPSPRNSRARRHILSLVFLVVACTVFSFFLSQLKLLRRENVSAGGGLGFSFERKLPDPETPLDESIVVMVPPVGNSVVVRPNVEQYQLETVRGLFQSLTSARYPTTVNLRVLLAPESDDNAFDRRYVVVQETVWNHGSFGIVNATTGGLFEIMLNAWAPAKNARERVVIIDAAFARSLNPEWFENLQTARVRYAHVSDVAAFTDKPSSVRVRSSVTGMVSHWQPPTLGKENPDNVFLYQSAPYIPVLAPKSAEQWRAFLRWFVARRSEWFLWPNVVHPRSHTDQEWKGFSARGRAHWSMWYSRFLAEHGLYVMFPRAEDPQVSKIARPTTPIGKLMRVSFDGNVVQDRSESGGATEEELNEIVRMARQRGGSVALTIVTEAFIETAHSWICNVDVGGFRPPATVWIAPDQASYEALRKVNGSHAIHMRSFKGGRKETGTHFNTPGYWLLMLERTRLIRDLLERGVGVFAFETDQIWLRNPIPAVTRLMESGDGVDLVGTLDTRNQIAGNFLYMAPTLASRRLWLEVAKRFSQAYHSAGMHLRHTAKFQRYIENDQSILTKLVFYATEFKQRNSVVFRALDTDRFVDGRWYDGNRFYGRSASSPTMINNNFLVGIEKKVARAKKFGHWFWNEGKCDAAKVRRAIEVNEMRAAGAEAAAKAASGSNAKPEEDFDVGIDKSIVGITKALKHV